MEKEKLIMFDKDKTILVLIDVQGTLARIMHDRERLFGGLTTLIQGLKILEVPIIWMEQIPEKLGSTIPEIAGLLRDLKAISKFTFSCCKNPEFMETFEVLNRNQVLLAGIETHICVYQTAMDLIQAGNEVQVVEDGVSSRTRENRKLGLKRIERAGGKITSTEMILFELMKEAKGDAFKKIVGLVK